MAEMVPDSLPAGRSLGERRMFDVLQRLPDDCIVYYEPEDGNAHAAFVVICPKLGLLVIKHAGWRAEHLGEVGKDDVKLVGSVPRIERNPVAEAQAYLDLVAERCRCQSGFEALLAKKRATTGRFAFRTGYAAFLPNLNQDELAAHAVGDIGKALPASQTITRDVFMGWHDNKDFALEQVEAALQSYMEDAPSNGPLTAGQIRTLRAILHPEIRLADKPEIPPASLQPSAAENIDIAVLDLRQERHARSLGSGHRLIFGVAGSGKTVILIARARYLALHQPQLRVLFLCFNVTLASYLRKKLSDCKNVAVHHFDEWSKLNHTTRGADGEGDDDLGDRLLRNLQARADVARTYDAILIDEAQDFAPSWFRCALAAIKDPQDGDLAIVSDGNQGLYRRTGVSWQSLGVRARGRTYHVAFDLDTNYRNTREIVELARHFASTSMANVDEGMACVAVDPKKARRSIGMRPVLFREPFRGAECDRAIELVRGLLAGKFMEQDLPHPLMGQEIGILYPLIPGQCRNEFNHFLDKLRELDSVVHLNPPRGRDARSRINEPGIKVQTIHSAKGLEYRAVIVLWADLLPQDFREDHDEEKERRLMYVALTRSMDFLAITYSRRSAFIEVIRESGAAALRA